MAATMSPAGAVLFGNTGTPDPGAAETEEQRKRRLQQLQAAQAGIQDRIGSGYGAALSAAGQTLGF